MSFPIGNKLAVGNVPWNKGLKTGLAPWLGKKRGPSTLRQPDIEKVCPTCSKQFTVRPTAKKQVVCSLKCRKVAHTGPDNVNWKGGVTPENKKERIRFQREMQKHVFKRDEYTCVMCNDKGGYLSVDHIKPWADHPELRFEESNLRTLCRACHYRVTFGKEIIPGTNWGHGLAKGNKS